MKGWSKKGEFFKVHDKKIYHECLLLFRFPAPSNADEFVTEELTNEQNMAIQSRWNKFLGKKNPNRWVILFSELES